MCLAGKQSAQQCGRLCSPAAICTIWAFSEAIHSGVGGLALDAESINLQARNGFSVLWFQLGYITLLHVPEPTYSLFFCLYFFFKNLRKRIRVLRFHSTEPSLSARLISEMHFKDVTESSALPSDSSGRIRLVVAEGASTLEIFRIRFCLRSFSLAAESGERLPRAVSVCAKLSSRLWTSASS